MAESFLYLTTKGRKTALPRRIEIWFVEREGRHYIVSERRGEPGALEKEALGEHARWKSAVLHEGRLHRCGVAGEP